MDTSVQETNQANHGSQGQAYETIVPSSSTTKNHVWNRHMVHAPNQTSRIYQEHGLSWGTAQPPEDPADRSASNHRGFTNNAQRLRRRPRRNLAHRACPAKGLS